MQKIQNNTNNTKNTKNTNNKKKPENKNIALTNKREKMIQVFRMRKWRFQDRFYVVDELIKNNYNR